MLYNKSLSQKQKEKKREREKERERRICSKVVVQKRKITYNEATYLAQGHQKGKYIERSSPA